MYVTETNIIVARWLPQPDHPKQPTDPLRQGIISINM